MQEIHGNQLTGWRVSVIGVRFLFNFPELELRTATEFFQMNQFFASDGQSIGVLVSASVLPVNIQTDLL